MFKNRKFVIYAVSAMLIIFTRSIELLIVRSVSNSDYIFLNRPFRLINLALQVIAYSLLFIFFIRFNDFKKQNMVIKITSIINTVVSALIVLLSVSNTFIFLIEKSLNTELYLIAIHTENLISYLILSLNISLVAFLIAYFRKSKVSLCLTVAGIIITIIWLVFNLLRLSWVFDYDSTLYVIKLIMDISINAFYVFGFILMYKYLTNEKEELGV